MKIVEFVGDEPIKKTKGAAAFDLTAAKDVTILPGEVVKVETNTRVAIPKDCVGLLSVRSSLGAAGVMLGNGVGIIDSDYRGPLIFALYNANVKQMLMALAIGSVTFDYNNGSLYKRSVPGVITIKKGERIGQLSILKQPKVEFKKVSELNSTDRGEDGFGSTGK